MLKTLHSIDKALGNKFLLNLFIILWLLFITNLWLPRNWGFYGNNDWSLTYSTFEIAYNSIVKHHQWPSYNPYLAFGSDLDANPQAVHAGFLMIPVLLFGSFYGYKLSILLALFIGVHGFRKLLISIGIGQKESFLLSLFFCSSSFFGQHIMHAGHSNFLHLYLIPYLFYFLNRFNSTGAFKHLILPSLIMSQMITGGAPIAFIITNICLICWCIYLLLIEKQKLLKTLNIYLSVLFALGISAWKIVAVMNFWQTYPRLSEDISAINPLIWLHALGDFQTDTGTPHDWHEISMGLGYLILIYTLVHIKLLKGFKVWLILFGLIFWLSLGNVPNGFNPWYFLNHHVPIFESLRAPSRFGFVLLFGMCLGFAKLLKLDTHKKLINIILISITLSNTLNYNSISRNLVFSQNKNDCKEEKFQQMEIVKTEFNSVADYRAIKNEAMVVNAYEPLYLSEVNDTLEQFVIGANVIQFTPNKLSLKSTDTLVQLNLRFDEHWYSEQAKTENQKGRLNLKTEKGLEIILQRHTRISRNSVILSVLSLLLLIGFGFFRLKPQLQRDKEIFQ
jgi:hypothetical protein